MGIRKKNEMGRKRKEMRQMKASSEKMAGSQRWLRWKMWFLGLQNGSMVEIKWAKNGGSKKCLSNLGTI